MFKRRISAVLLFVIFLISSLGNFSPERVFAMSPEQQKVIQLETLEKLQTPSNGEDFTYAVVPDTQGLSKSDSGANMLRGAFQWLAQQKDALNVKFVSSLGDMTQKSTPAEWSRIKSAYDILRDNGIPFSPCQGNHNHIEGLREAFPVSEFSGKPWFEGYHNGMENACYLFSAGGMDFVLVVIQAHTKHSGDDRASIEWANQKLAQYSNRRAIFATHDFYQNNSLIDEVIKKHDNLFLAVCGHSHTEKYWTEKTIGGNTVHCIVSDYQSRPNGGEGMLRYYTFRPGENRIYAYTYNPTTKQYETDADSQFNFEYKMR